MSDNADFKFIETLTEISLEYGSVEKTLNAFADFTKTAVAYVETSQKGFHISAAPTDFSENIRLYPFEEILRIYMHFPVKNEDMLMGSIVINSSPDIFFPYNRFLSHLANAVKICALLGDVKITPFNSDRSILNVAISGRSEDFALCRRYLKQKRINPDGCFYVLAIYTTLLSTNFKDINTTFERLKGVAGCFPMQFICCITDNFIIFDFSVNENNQIASILHNFKEIIEEVSSDDCKCAKIFMGLGNLVKGFERTATSWKQAICAIKLSMLRNEATCLRWQDMGALNVLACSSFQQEYAISCTNILKPLIEHDNSHHGNLLATLVIYVKNHWNLSTSAREMYMHYNSIKYRYNNISSILKMDLDQSNIRFNLSIAVFVYIFSLPIEEFCRLLHYIMPDTKSITDMQDEFLNKR